MFLGDYEIGNAAKATLENTVHCYSSICSDCLIELHPFLQFQFLCGRKLQWPGYAQSRLGISIYDSCPFCRCYRISPDNLAALQGDSERLRLRNAMIARSASSTVMPSRDQSQSVGAPDATPPACNRVGFQSARECPEGTNGA
jgi:hypothetical protein